MNIARLNFSHGDLAYHGTLIANVRAAALATKRDVAVLADLPGPKIRIGDLAEEPVMLADGAPFVLTTEPILGDATRASVNLESLPKAVRPGNRLFLNDGNIELEVTGVRGPEVRCKVIAGGELRSKKGLNLPGIDLGVRAFTDRDRECLAFAVEHGADAISQSFVESAADLEEVRQAAGDLGHDLFLIAKIERARALDRIDEIMEAADGIMVARGDLGVEVPIERTAVLQKALIRKAMFLGKPVITATQMLESMIKSPRPTRAEATDVANAILDGTDAIMLSGESASGLYPLEAVETLARIATTTEPTRNRVALWERMHELAVEVAAAESAPEEASVHDLISQAVESVLETTSAAAVIAPSRTGLTARRIARYRLPVWVASPSPSEATRRQLAFSYGVQPLLVHGEDLDWSAFGRAWIKKERLTGRLMVVVQGPSRGNPNINHRMELIELEKPA
ncbi:MAG TPA: pyruvate kinase, partial [Candidatus Udaeobacter sp.]|nr:pyruvate kinase [Candidatus Udaeobacter sp.]